VLKVQQSSEALFNDVMGFSAAHIYNERNTAGIMFERGVV
jgi:hypothetical protein